MNAANAADERRREPHTEADLLIIGAGPFGLALSAHATRTGIRHSIVGEPMAFWRSNMPAGMILRSDADWHFDTAGEHTIERYYAKLGRTRSEIEPLPLDVYLGYCDWFREEKGIDVQRTTVERLDRGVGPQRFTAQLADGGTIGAERVVLALGVGFFEHAPAELTRAIPAGRFRHTRDYVNFSDSAGRRVLILGGRMSAFEWAALLREAGAEAVYVSFRKETPAFTHSDWSWVMPLVDRTTTDPGWYRALGSEEKDALFQHFWQEGRLKLEPWVAPRVQRDGITLLPGTQLVECRETSAGDLRVLLNDGTRIEVDDVVLATGYKPDVARVPFLSSGNVLAGIETEEGSPTLGLDMQSSVPGLYFTSACAIRDFGPTFGFTVAVRASAEMLVRSISAS
jgi:FAD-dependent urate hydroxylase